MTDQATAPPSKRPIGPDEVALIEAALERFRFTVKLGFPGISRINECAKLAALLEIMEILWLDFADDSARLNAISDIRELYPRQ
jgi:hypothetical protein